MCRGGQWKQPKWWASCRELLRTKPESITLPLSKALVHPSSSVQWMAPACGRAEESSEVREDVEWLTKMTKALEDLTYMRNTKRWELSLEAEEEPRIVKATQYCTKFCNTRTSGTHWNRREVSVKVERVLYPVNGDYLICCHRCLWRQIVPKMQKREENLVAIWVNTKSWDKVFNICDPIRAEAAELWGMQTADINQAYVLFLNNISSCSCQRENVGLVLLVWPKKLVLMLLFLLCVLRQKTLNLHSCYDRALSKEKLQST